MRQLRMLLAAAVLFGLLGASSPSHPSDASALLVPTAAAAETMLPALARQAAYCSLREDTGHPAFSGCIDWHSAVHGTWALLAFERATGNTKYRELVDFILDPAKLQRERRDLQRDQTFEMPYGRSWFLRLAIDADRLGYETSLREFADEVAVSLLRYLSRKRLDPLRGSYESDGWALLNLFDYFRHRGAVKGEQAVAALIRQNYLAGEPECDYRVERGQFMAVCTMWAALVSRVLGPEEFALWADSFLTRSGLPQPVQKPLSSHHYGLNFSRAWGLWDLYRATDREDVLESYIAHVNAGYEPTSNWNGDYGSVGHWVAQFGVFALQPLFGPDRGR